MKNIKKVLVLVLLLCSLAALLTAGAYAEGSDVSVPTVMSTGSGSTQKASFSAQDGRRIYHTAWVLDEDAGGALLLDFDPVSSDLNYGTSASINVVSNNAPAGNYKIHCDFEYEDDLSTTYTARGSVTVNTPAPARPSFNISASAGSYTIGTSAPISLSVADKQNMDGYTVVWTIESADGAAGAFSSNMGDNVSVSYFTAGTSVIKAYIMFGSEAIWAGNSVQITVAAAPEPTPTPTPVPTPTIVVTPETLNLLSGNAGYVKADLGNAPAGTIINWTSAGHVTLSASTSTSGSAIMVTAGSGITTAETAAVTATIAGTDISKTCNVTIAPNGVKHINVTADNYYPKVGETITVTASIEYSTPGDQVTAWKFDSSILQCTEMTGSYAKFKALKAGKSRVTAVSGTAETFIDITVGGQTITHQITYGNYSTFDGTNPLYFTTNEIIANFKGVTVDGYALTNGNQYYMSSKDGEHILVALNPAFLKMLSSSNYHTIQIYSTVNQPATGYFRNYSTTQTIYGVKTGDDNNIALWVSLCVIGFAGAAAIIITKRKDIFGNK